MAEVPRRPRVYVAGPLSAGNQELNVRRACAAALALMRAGFAPHVPHLTAFFDRMVVDLTASPVPYETWMEISLAWVAASEAVLRLSSTVPSPGADREVALAESLGIPVYHSVQDLLAAFGMGP